MKYSILVNFIIVKFSSDDDEKDRFDHKAA